MRLWLFYIYYSYRPSAAEVVFDDVTKSETNPDEDEGADGSILDFLSNVTPDDPCGCLLLLFLLLFLTIIGSSIMIITQAPIILTEVAFEFLLAVGVVRAAKKIDYVGWAGSVFLKTWQPFTAILFCALFFGSCSELYCNKPQTIIDVIYSCGD